MDRNHSFHVGIASEHGGGFPPFQAQTFASQLIWLAIAFVLLYALMSKLAQNGLAILMISSELPEVLGMSDRVLVMNGGRIIAEIARKDATSETVGAAMTLVQDQEAAA